MTFTAMDFETANSNRSSICSIGLAFVENGKVVDTDYILVKPTPNYFDPFNTMLHGIDERETKKQKTFRQLWKELKLLLHNQIVIAHNASFDFSCLRYALDSSRLAYPNLDYHCTYRLAQVATNLSSYRLHEVSRHFKIKLNHHHAESDAKACALMALKLIEKHKANSLLELSSSFGFKIGKIMSETKSYRPFSFH